MPATETEGTESETDSQRLHNCRHVWQGDYPEERALHTTRGAAACAHDYVLGGLELIEDGSPDEAADWALNAKLFLTGFLERCDGESLAIAGGVLPIADQERGEFSEIATVLEEARQQDSDGLTRALQEAHRRLHNAFDTDGDLRLSGVPIPSDAGSSYRRPTAQGSDEEGSTGPSEVRCPDYITHDRREKPWTWEPQDAFELTERAHDEVRGALEELAEKENPGVAAGLLVSAANTIGQALGQLDEYELGLVPTEERSRHIGKIAAADPNLTALAEKACHESPDELGAIDRCLSLMEALEAIAFVSERVEGRPPIRKGAVGLIVEIARQLEEARKATNVSLVRRDYAISVLSGDPDGYAASRADNPPINLNGNGGEGGE